MVSLSRLAVLCVAVLFTCGLSFAQDAPAPTQPPEKNVEKARNPVVVIETSLGAIKAELWPDKAPVTVANFLAYTNEKFYDGLIFHRVIDGFMIQGGGFNAKMEQKNTTHDPIKNEATADKKNLRGTLAMARTAVVDSATSQFFINLADNAFLDHKDNTPAGFGYCAFGKVIEGLDIVDKIGKAQTVNRAGYQDVPAQTIEIKSVRVAE